MQQKEIKSINEAVAKIITENPELCVWRAGAQLNVPMTNDLLQKCLKCNTYETGKGGIDYIGISKIYGLEK